MQEEDQGLLIIDKMHQTFRNLETTLADISVDYATGNHHGVHYPDLIDFAERNLEVLRSELSKLRAIIKK